MCVLFHWRWITSNQPLSITTGLTSVMARHFYWCIPPNHRNLKPDRTHSCNSMMIIIAVHQLKTSAKKR